MAVLFEPIMTGHAVERCAASIFFKEPIPEKALLKISEAIPSDFPQAGFVKTSITQGFQIDAATGRVTPLGQGGGGPQNFTAGDRSFQLKLTSSSISIQTTAYLRWSQFEDFSGTYLVSVASKLLEMTSIGAVQLEYWDRFLWSGDWTNFDPKHVLDFTSPYLCAGAAQEATQWHSHCGWFESLDDGFWRRLVNVNIDAVEVQRPGRLSQPSLGIYTLTQDQLKPDEPLVNGLGSDTATIRASLNRQHLALKKLLLRVILKNMADRIGLKA